MCKSAAKPKHALRGSAALVHRWLCTELSAGFPGWDVASPLACTASKSSPTYTERQWPCKMDGEGVLLLHSLGIFTFMYLKWWLTVLIESLLPSKSCSYNTWQHKNQGLPQDTREALLSIHHVFNLIHVNMDGSSVCQRETSSRAADGPRTAAHLSTNPGSWDHTVTSSCLKMIISITSERHRQGKENHMQKCQF